MSFDKHAENLTNYLEAEWDYQDAALIYDEEGSGKKEPKYITVTILDGDTISLINANRFVGEVVFQVITRQNTGGRVARQLADKLFELFHNHKIDGTTYGPVRINRIGNAKGVYQINVIAPFKYDA